MPLFSRHSNKLGIIFDSGSVIGGTKIIDGDYILHVFTEPGSLISNQPIKVDYLVVGGGGGSGSAYGGGGGGGGVKTASNYTIPAGSHNIVVGAGGTTSEWLQVIEENDRGVGYPGSDSLLGNLVSAGGGGKGGGAYVPSTSPEVAEHKDGGPGTPNGGSGGGGGAYFQTGGAGTGTLTFGYNGAAAPALQHGGGGGGAGQEGGRGPTNTPQRKGGDGVAVPWMPADYGTSGPEPGRYFGGGGSGGAHTEQSSPDGSTIPGGAGGGGSGINAHDNGNVNQITKGLINTGGGGGGGGGNLWCPGKGVGGPGIVAIRYHKSAIDDLFSATGGTEITVPDGNSPTNYYRYHVFISPGTLTTSGPTNNPRSDVTIMLVGGGGSGASANSGGGGGGGGGAVMVKSGNDVNLHPATYGVTIGLGGGPVGTGANDAPGDDTFLSTPANSGTSAVLIARGGGAGGHVTTGPGQPGQPNPTSRWDIYAGSGGGGIGAYNQSQQGGTGSTPGGAGVDDAAAAVSSMGGMGGGGGGAGGPGGTGSIQYPASPTPTSWKYVLANGGNGRYVPQFPSAVIAPAIPNNANWVATVGSGYYGGGGGGGGQCPNSGVSPEILGGDGGLGGGGDGHRYPDLAGTSQVGRIAEGIEYTGGGGGGNDLTVPNQGGRGLFVIRYAVNN